MENLKVLNKLNLKHWNCVTFLIQGYPKWMMLRTLTYHNPNKHMERKGAALFRNYNFSSIPVQTLSFRISKMWPTIFSFSQLTEIFQFIRKQLNCSNVQIPSF